MATGLYVCAVAALVWTDPGNWLAHLERLLRLAFLQRP